MLLHFGHKAFKIVFKTGETNAVVSGTTNTPQNNTSSSNGSSSSSNSANSSKVTTSNSSSSGGASSGSSGSGSSSSSSSSGSNSSSGQTDEEKEAAEKATEIAQYNLEAIQNQLRQAIANYDLADTQNRASADKQKKDASRKASEEQFGQTKSLQNTMRTVLGNAGTALNSSLYGDLSHAARTRMDLDLGDTYKTLLENWNTIENAYQDAANANQVSRNEALSNYIYNASQLASNLAADRYNSGYSTSNGNNESLADVEKLLGISDLSKVYDQNSYAALLAAVAPYITEANSSNAAQNIQPANTVNSGGYMSGIANAYNNRKVS